MCTSIYIKPIPCVEKDEKRKVAQSGGYRILFNCSNSTIERYIVFRKDEKGKLHKVVVVEPAGGKNRRQKFVRAIKGRCSIIYYIFSALILHNCILYTDLVNCQIHIVKLYCAIVSCIRCMKT